MEKYGQVVVERKRFKIVGFQNVVGLLKLKVNKGIQKDDSVVFLMVREIKDGRCIGGVRFPLGLVVSGNDILK